MIIYSSTHYHHQPWERYHLYATMVFWAGHLQVIIRHFTQDIFLYIFIYIIFHLFEPWIIDDEWGNRYIPFFLFYFSLHPYYEFSFSLAIHNYNFESWRRMALGDYITLREMREVGWGRSSWAKKRAERAVLIDVRERDAILIDLVDDRLIPWL
jgi:hypothetical protein